MLAPSPQLAARELVVAARTWQPKCARAAATPGASAPVGRRSRVSARRGQLTLNVQASAAPSSGESTAALDGHDLELLQLVAQVSQGSVGQTQPHPNAGCVLVDSQGGVLSQAFLWAQGTEPPEVAAVRQAAAGARGATAYLNLECGDCHGDQTAVAALLQGGVRRVVLGLRHPLPHSRGVAVRQLRAAGVEVAVLGEALCSASSEAQAAALDACLLANEALLHRAAARLPLGVLKYAMTLDGKIATERGHSAWVSSPESRQRVFEMRARSDAVIVGGQTVRRDNPRLTTRREGGHQPVRIVMSRTLELPADANLWDVSHAPTIVMTQRGARLDFQQMLRSRGVEVVEFDFLTPQAVAGYCYSRGFLQLLWECGGTLAAPAIAGGVIHKALAFVAPKLIGGTRAPTPVGDLGFVEMTQALVLSETRWEPSGPDVLLTGYLPSSGGPRALAGKAAALAGDDPSSSSSSSDGGSGEGSSTQQANGATPGSQDLPSADSSSGGSAGSAARARALAAGGGVLVAEFYKAWDKFGSLSNFSPHPISMPEGPMTPARVRELQRQRWPEHAPGGAARSWPSAEHYYQAQKFAGASHPEAAALVEAIAAAGSPEEAAARGRRTQRQRPELLREDWDAAKVAVMYAGLRAKFGTHAGPRQMLLATATVAGSCGGGGGLLLVESSPHDYFWGRGFDGSGQNMLGKLLMCIRGELVEEQPQAVPAPSQQQQQQQLDAASASRQPANAT